MFYAPDDCNICTCLRNGTFIRTAMLCEPCASHLDQAACVSPSCQWITPDPACGARGPAVTGCVRIAPCVDANDCRSGLVCLPVYKKPGWFSACEVDQHVCVAQPN